ncbi:MAG TPA: DUF3368 domain-containing protein [Geobacterales bacterium]|nr:DUF3368 domain-containing protein [Geobacterales bacterium]
MLDKLVAYKEAMNVELVLTEEVYSELMRNDAFKDIENFLMRNFKKFNTPSNIIEEIRLSNPNLGPGELSVLASAIYILRQNNETTPTAIMDDRKGRKAAKSLNLNVHGTLWIILQLKNSGIISKARAMEVIRSLPERGFYIKGEELQEAITKA